MSQNGSRTTSLMTSLTKICNPQPKKFFQVQTRRLADAFEPLNSSIAQSAEELWHWQGNRQLLVLAWFQSTNTVYPSSQSVKLMYSKCLDHNCNGNRCDKVALRTICIKNVKFKIVKIKTGCKYVGYFYCSEHLTWATQNLGCGLHSWSRSFLSYC